MPYYVICAAVWPARECGSDWKFQAEDVWEAVGTEWPVLSPPKPSELLISLFDSKFQILSHLHSQAEAPLEIIT